MMVSPLSILDKAASRCVQFSSAYCFLQRFERHQSLLIACAAYNNNNNISLDFFLSVFVLAIGSFSFLGYHVMSAFRFESLKRSNYAVLK